MKLWRMSTSRLGHRLKAVGTLYAHDGAVNRRARVRWPPALHLRLFPLSADAPLPAALHSRPPLPTTAWVIHGAAP